MAFAVAGATGVAEGVVIDDPACASVSYASFWTDLAAVTDAPAAPASTALAAAR
jgi:5-enolpyruvylshikimate-3-phosphate synthase